MVDCRVVMLPMGQGAMNLIEIYDGGKLVNLTMIDCGGDDGNLWSKAAREESLEYAAGKMRQRFQYSQPGLTNYYLDNLILTHKDQDHWNMLKPLWKKVIGEPLCFTSDTVGSLETTGEEGEQRFYFVNKNTDLCFYRITIENDLYTLEESIYHRQQGFPPGYEVEFEFTYKEKRLQITFHQQNLNIAVLWEEPTEEMWHWKISIFPIFQFLCRLDADGINEVIDKKFQIPGDIEGFIILFDYIYNKYLVGYMEISDEHRTLIYQSLGNIWVDRETIEEVVIDESKETPSFIQRTFIGGSWQGGKRFNEVKQFITSISGETFYAVKANDSIALYSHIALYFIQRLSVLPLIKLAGAESASSLSIQNNATSIVSALVSENIFVCQKVVFSGDATAHTFYRMLCDLKERDCCYGNAIWTAPHHGSTATCIGWLHDESEEVFVGLLDAVFPAGMVISAGIENRHGHPGNTFTELLVRILNEVKPEAHDLYFNTNDNSKRLGAAWKWLPVRCNLYSTYTRLPSGNAGKETYAAYIIPFLGEGIETVPVENLWTKAEVGNRTLCIEKKEQTASGMPLFSKKTEIPSKELFFCR